MSNTRDELFLSLTFRSELAWKQLYRRLAEKMRYRSTREVLLSDQQFVSLASWKQVYRHLAEKMRYWSTREVLWSNQQYKLNISKTAIQTSRWEDALLIDRKLCYQISSLWTKHFEASSLESSYTMFLMRRTITSINPLVDSVNQINLSTRSSCSRRSQKMNIQIHRYTINLRRCVENNVSIHWFIIKASTWSLIDHETHWTLEPFI
jgi:hypothetical protein